MDELKRKMLLQKMYQAQMLRPDVQGLTEEEAKIAADPIHAELMYGKDEDFPEAKLSRDMPVDINDPLIQDMAINADKFKDPGLRVEPPKDPFQPPKSFANIRKRLGK